MKGRRKSISKSASSGFVVSLLFHAGVFLIAGMLIVFTVHHKEEKKFVPPKPVDRPKMNLKKPKVNVKQKIKPKPTTRIVTKMKSASMPELQLPEMGGMVGDIGGGIGGFELMPDLQGVTTFGGGQSIGNDFVGIFYDIKRDRSGRDLPEHSREGFVDILEEFLKKGFKKSVLNQYYRSPKKLYTTTFAMPPDLSLMAPQAFGEHDTVGYFWIAHYKGELVYPEDITFRFWGSADDIMGVRVDGEYVFLAANSWSGNGADALQNIWSSTSADSHKYPLGYRSSVVGDWITLKAGEPLDMEVVLAEIPGGCFQALLCVEVKGEEYPRNPFRNGPLLPIFKTEVPSLDLVEAIHEYTFEGELSVTNGPVFRDFPVRPKQASLPDVSTEVEASVEQMEADAMRFWTIDGHDEIEAEFITVIGNEVVLRSKKGKQVKVDKERFSDNDIRYISLETPPKFTLDFKTNRRQIPSPEQPPDTWARPITIFGFEFGVNVSQRSSKDYPHELNVEYFAIGDEVSGDNFVLLDHQSSSFKLTAENKRFHSFKGEQVRTIRKGIWPDTPLHGVMYSGYIVILTDERGKIIQYSTTRKFLFENLESLRKIPVGKHFNKECIRVGPPRLTLKDRLDGM